MKQILITGAFCLLAAGTALAQAPAFNNTVVNTQLGNINLIDAKPGKVEGTVYLNQNWRPGTIYLKTGQAIKDFQINYDLEHDMVEIETKDGIKVLPGNKVAKFTIWNGFKTDSLQYVNCDGYTYNNIRHNGFYEVLHPGAKVQLLLRTDLEIQKANFNAITNTGNKNDVITKKEKLYVATSGNTVKPFQDSDDFTVFGQLETKVKEYAKTNKLKPKRKEDAAKLIAYYNSI